MNPVFGSLANKVLLGSSRGRVTADRVSFRADKIVEFRQFNHKGVIIVFEEGLGIETSGEDRFQMPTGLFLGRSVGELKGQREVKTHTSCFLMIF